MCLNQIIHLSALFVHVQFFCRLDLVSCAILSAEASFVSSTDTLRLCFFPIFVIIGPSLARLPTAFSSVVCFCEQCHIQIHKVSLSAHFLSVWPLFPQVSCVIFCVFIPLLIQTVIYYLLPCSIRICSLI